MVIYETMKEGPESEVLSPEVQDVMRNLVSAFRAVKLYPPNNPVYSQSVKKSYETLQQFLDSSPDYHAGVQKTWFTYQQSPIGKEAQLNKAIAQDLFAKGIREIVFTAGVTETELLVLCQALALSPEELAIKSGISSILWEKSADHIKVIEAGLDEVITSRTDGAGAAVDAGAGETAERNKTGFPGRTLVLGELLADPEGFGANMLELAKQTRAENESVEDRLYDLYQEAGRQIDKEHPGESETLYEGLAKSVLTLEQHFREALVSGKLYRDLDTELANDPDVRGDPALPNALQEIQGGRFPDTWTVQQVAVLLKKSSTKKAPQPPLRRSPGTFEVVPISAEISRYATDLAEYSPDEMTELKNLSEAGMEADIVEAAVRTLVFLIPLVKTPGADTSDENDVTRFSGIVRQLEDMLSYLLKKKDYVLATHIIHALRQPVEPVFRTRMTNALKKASSKEFIVAAIEELRKHPKSDREYQAAYAFVATQERAATEVLLNVLAEEQDRSIRIFYLDLIKELAKNQVALLGEHINDERWYVVRNIVSILSETKSDQAVTLLRKAADHANVRIRQEVIKGLTSIGGKKAAVVLSRFLRDRNDDVLSMAVRAYAELSGVGVEEARPLIEFLETRHINKRESELTLEAIKSLGKTGGKEALEFLKQYTRIRWWKSRKLQYEIRDAAVHAMEDIERRKTYGERGKR